MENVQQTSIHMIKRIAHIGLAVGNLDDAQSIFTSLLGMKPSHVQRVEEQKVDVSSFHIDDTNIELTCGISEDSPISKFIEKRGEGIHHIAFEVDDIHAELARLKAAGVRLIDEQPRVGADNYLVAFVHPKSANGVLVEICQPQ
jgi:methylmalonyl-CoA/ethylmalonyl-CoA epimerase